MWDKGGGEVKCTSGANEKVLERKSGEVGRGAPTSLRLRGGARRTPLPQETHGRKQQQVNKKSRHAASK